MATRKFYGKYQGTVVQNVDPYKTGRIMAEVPDVLGSRSGSWALPCVPVAGKGMGMYAVPPVGASVWIEFEQGDPDHPIWSGCKWRMASDVPALALAAPPGVQTICLQTTLQNTVLISDAPGPTGGIILKNRSGAMIMVNDTGITLNDGKGGMIVLAAGTVTVNQGALVVK